MADLEIPEHIRKRAAELELFFKLNGIKEWALMGIQSRSIRHDSGMGCALAGPGRGDCLHFCGVPAVLNEQTTDVYGKPNDWCWPCWKDWRLERAQSELAAERTRAEDLFSKWSGKVADAQRWMERAEQAEARLAEKDQIYLDRLDDFKKLSKEKERDEARLAEAMQLLRVSYDQMFSWFSSEYAEHPNTIKLRQFLSSTAPPPILAEVERLRAEHDKMVERSMGAMQIAEGDEGYERIKPDCPMMAAVLDLRHNYAALKQWWDLNPNLLQHEVAAQSKRADSAEQERDRLKACLEAGTAPAIMDGLFREAERLGFYKPTAKHALTQFVEEVERLRAQLQVANDALEQIRRQSVIAGYDSGDSLINHVATEALSQLNSAEEKK
jgi:predicted  nucleic acid-binding Zn-ribbon protein